MTKLWAIRNMVVESTSSEELREISHSVDARIDSAIRIALAENGYTSLDRVSILLSDRNPDVQVCARKAIKTRKWEGFWIDP